MTICAHKKKQKTLTGIEKVIVKFENSQVNVLREHTKKYNNEHVF